MSTRRALCLLSLCWAAVGHGAAPGRSPAGLVGGTGVLFANEAWYRSEAAVEAEFRGLLQAVEDAGAPSAMQRPTHYRLGGIAVYTSGRRVAALDALVGREVVIVGKRVEFALTGQRVVEIWPGSVRRP